jgi:NAD(P)H-dependent FMN reductase
MKTIITIGGSNSKNSINKILAEYTADQLKEVIIKPLDLNDYDLPLYGIDYENDNGIAPAAHELLKEIKGSDGIVLSLAEHNGAYSTAFKNAFDWMSRIDGKLWSEKPMLLMATSPGARGGATVLDIAKNRFPYMGGNIVADLSFPSFFENFKNGVITDDNLNAKLKEAIRKFEKAL